MRHSLLIFTLFALGCAVVQAQGDGQIRFADKPHLIHAKNTGPVVTLSFARDGLLVSASLMDIRGVDAHSGQEKFSRMDLNARTIAPDGASGKVAMVFRETMSLADQQNGKEELVLDPFGNWDRNFPFRPTMVALTFTPKGDMLACGGSVAKTGGRHGLPGGVVTCGKPGPGRRLTDSLAFPPESVRWLSAKMASWLPGAPTARGVNCRSLVKW